MWAGFVESRLRKLVSDLLGRSLPIKRIQLWPKKFEACIADKSALLTQAQRQNCITYFIGFLVDKNRMRGDQLNVEMQLQNFRDWDLSRFQPLNPGMDILVKHFKLKDLPKICFEGMYTGGKVVAMQKRRQLRDADPARQERKKLVRLEELKAKMAEIQRKKEEQQDRKRKREVDQEEEDSKDVNQAVGSSDVATEKEETTEESQETDLLESALDTIQNEKDKKSREEAEMEKQQLLDGALIVEEEPDADGYESDENAVGYTKDEARQVILHKTNKEDKYKDKRSLPVSDEVAEALRKLGYNIVSDDEAVTLGTNMIPPWQHRLPLDGDNPSLPKDFFPSSMRIRFREKFDMVELDAFGHVIDKGDDDFKPSKSWIGRKAGFEFKLSERGLGYYRTGKKVIVPSNTSY
jgi:hypothetical protein